MVDSIQLEERSIAKAASSHLPRPTTTHHKHSFDFLTPTTTAQLHLVEAFPFHKFLQPDSTSLSEVANMQSGISGNHLPVRLLRIPNLRPQHPKNCAPPSIPS